MSKESWEAMSAETQALQDSNEEYQRRCETLEAQIRAVREELTESLGMLMKRDTELKETKETLRITSGELQATNEDLKNVKVAHTEEIVLREAYQRGEERLDRVATGLKDTVKRSVAEVGGLFDKLGMFPRSIFGSLNWRLICKTFAARKASVASGNSNAVVAFGKTLSAESSALTGRLEEFVKEHTRLTTKLKGETEQFRTAEVEVRILSYARTPT
jgi:kinesin family protein 11